jgi:hypothetical protein
MTDATRTEPDPDWRAPTAAVAPPAQDGLAAAAPVGMPAHGHSTGPADGPPHQGPDPTAVLAPVPAAGSTGAESPVRLAKPGYAASDYPPAHYPPAEYAPAGYGSGGYPAGEFAPGGYAPADYRSGAPGAADGPMDAGARADLAALADPGRSAVSTLTPPFAAGAAFASSPDVHPGQRRTETVTCPQCGTVVTIDPRSRSSLDFCPNPACDYPLFWVRTAISVPDDLGRDTAAHKRMPGTVGRAAAAFVPCPHCAEPNQLSAVTCVRCGLDMRPAPPPPPPAPEPVAIAEPLLLVEEDEEEPINWWLIIGVALAITLFVAFVVVIALSYLV